MKKCCIKDCDSHKENGTQNIEYFKFPVDNEKLLKKWLKQLDLPNWKPSTYHHICSMHFQSKDFDSHPDKKQNCLKPTSIPTIFPSPPVNAVTPNPPTESENNQFQLPAKIVNMASNALVLQTSPAFLIPSPHSSCCPAQLAAQFPTQLITHNLNQALVNNSMQISTEYMKKQIEAQHSQMPLNNFAQTSVQYLEQIKSQSSQTSVQYLEQIKSPNSQTSVQYLEQIRSQNSQVSIQSSSQISSQYIKQIDERNSLQNNVKNGMHIAVQCPQHIAVQCPQHVAAQCQHVAAQCQHVAAQCPQHIAALCSQHIAAQCPQHITVQCPQHIAVQIPIQTTMQYPKQIPMQIPAQTPTEYPKQISVQIPPHTPTNHLKQAPPQGSVEIIGEYPNQVPTSIDPDQNEKSQYAESIALLVPILQPGLRKILPKPQAFDPDALPMVRFLQRCQSSPTNISIPKPDILIIPKHENSYPNGSGRVVISRYPGNKKPILRISISKEYISKKTPCSHDEEETNSIRSSSTRQMTIENSSTNKAVTFNLDPRTGEIVVTTRQLNDTTKDEAASEPTRIGRKVDNAHTSATKLRQLYIKGQQDCLALRRRLRVLRQCHKQEQEEIQKLQEHLTELGDEVQNTNCVDSSELRCAKRKETENSVQPESYKILLREVKKIKNDMQRTRRDLSTLTNNPSQEQENSLAQMEIGERPVSRRLNAIHRRSSMRTEKK